ncbi:hypothetical protein LMG28138_04282 [Pararobbsia alpina]|uniref:Uncharacterized protein n=1 Tax=Pararobbsia alpina TaxID=621374 RepID=A0A6S7BED6_9BURK|nr:hypothetical protein LMG28138_04282 [Pararobbsia alpina]
MPQPLCHLTVAHRLWRSGTQAGLSRGGSSKRLEKRLEKRCISLMPLFPVAVFPL